jgi:hypothetical protein
MKAHSSGIGRIWSQPMSPAKLVRTAPTITPRTGRSMTSQEMSGEPGAIRRNPPFCTGILRKKSTIDTRAALRGERQEMPGRRSTYRRVTPRTVDRTPASLAIENSPKEVQAMTTRLADALETIADLFERPQNSPKV